LEERGRLASAVLCARDRASEDLASGHL
jgi:hypothetical protein